MTLTLIDFNDPDSMMPLTLINIYIHVHLHKFVYVHTNICGAIHMCGTSFNASLIL